MFATSAGTVATPIDTHAKESALITTDQADLTAALRDAIRSSDPRMSKYAALPRILTFDDFNQGAHGWVELGGNYNGRGDLDSMDEHFRDFRPPQLSNQNFFDVGTHGAMTGTYSLKLATRKAPGHTATAIRRLTMSGRGLLQIEAYLAWKVEANLVGGDEVNRYGDISWDANSHPSEAQFGAFTVATDLSHDGIRYHNVMRFQNADWDGHLVQKWMYPVVAEPTPHERFEGKHDYSRYTDFTAPDPDELALPERPAPGGLLQRGADQGELALPEIPHRHVDPLERGAPVQQ